MKSGFYVTRSADVLMRHYAIVAAILLVYADVERRC